METKRRESNKRRQALIEAALECIAQEGLQSATVRKVADYAGVTNGLIRFYFSGKDELIRAAYAALLEHIYVTARVGVEDESVPAKVRLREFIRATLSPPIVAPRTVLLWANFLPLTYSDPEMAAIRREAYVDTTDILAVLIADSFQQEDKVLDDKAVQSFAIQVNAIIDGLWLEGSLAADKFAKGELEQLGLHAASSVLQLSLDENNG